MSWGRTFLPEPDLGAGQNCKHQDLTPAGPSLSSSSTSPTPVQPGKLYPLASGLFFTELDVTPRRAELTRSRPIFFVFSAKVFAICLIAVLNTKFTLRRELETQSAVGVSRSILRAAQSIADRMTGQQHLCPSQSG